MDFELYLKSRIVREHLDIDFNNNNFLHLLSVYNGSYNKIINSYKNVDENILNAKTKNSIDENIKASLFDSFMINLDDLNVEKINLEVSVKIFNSFYNDLFNKRVLSLNLMSKSKRKGKPLVSPENLQKVFNLAFSFLIKDKNIDMSSINPYCVSYSNFDFFDLFTSLLKADFILENPLKLNEYNFYRHNDFKYKDFDIIKFVNDKGFNYIINSLFRSESGKMYLINTIGFNKKYESRLMNIDFNDILDSGIFKDSFLNELKEKYFDKFKYGNFSLVYLNDFLNGLDINKYDSIYLYGMYSSLIDYDYVGLFRKNLIRYLDIESSIDLNVVSFMNQKRNKDLEKKLK